MTETVVAEPRRLRFVRRPSPVLVEHRPLYKITQLLLVLHMSSRGGKSTLPRLHLFNWALKSTDRIQKLLDAAKAKVLHMTAWGFDPALAIAIRFAVAESLVEATSTGYQLTEKIRAGLTERIVKDLAPAIDETGAAQIARLIVARWIAVCEIDYD